MGCGSYRCPRLALPGGQRTSAIFVVCNYDPSYIKDVQTYTFGRCSESSCPSSSSRCVDFTGRTNLTEVFDDDTKADGQLCGKFAYLFNVMEKCVHVGEGGFWVCIVLVEYSEMIRLLPNCSVKSGSVNVIPK